MMEEQLVTWYFIHSLSISVSLMTPYCPSPVCGKNVRSRDINKHLDENCSARTVVDSSSQESAQCDASARDSFQRTRVPNAPLAPIFSNKLKSVPTLSSGSYTQRKDTPNATFSQGKGKRPVAVGSPTPAPKRQKPMLNVANVPLAEKLRPKELSDFVGQAHLMEPGSLLSTMLKTEATWSVVLWGPPG